jgi:hypothetical protein
MLEFSGFNTRYWQHPLVNKFREEMSVFTANLKQSLVQLKLRKEFQITDDPWENFLAHDAKHFLPLLNHKAPMSLRD